MRALVFGATGFLGRFFVSAATAQGWEVTPVVRGADVPGSFWCDLDHDRVANPEPHDVAVFLAQSPRYAEFPEGAAAVLQTNVSGLARALEVARAAGVSRFLYASSGSVYPVGFEPVTENDAADAGGPYARSKRFGEGLIEDWAPWFSSASLRFFALYGPGQEGKLVPNLIRRVRNGESVVLAPAVEGEASPQGFTTTPCHVDDATSALLALAESSFSGPINVAGPEACSIRSIAEAVGAAVGRAPRFDFSPDPRPGDLIANVDLLQQVTGLPKVDFRTGLDRTLERSS